MSILLKQLLTLVFILLTCGFSAPQQALPTSWLDHELVTLKTHAPGINLNVLRLSLKAYLKAKQEGFATKPILTVIDYSKPSSQKRLWVFDLKKGTTLFNTWVSHGKNSGDVNATSFSNVPGSLKSALGVFVTGQTYMGKNGYSLHMKGLEKGINNNAYNRSIVIHGASYVNAELAKKYGRIGRSWGCPAVTRSLSKPLIDTIKNNSLIFAYYPDRKWLSHSQFLAG